MQPILITLDLTSRKPCTAAGAQVSELPPLVVGDTPVLWFDLVKADRTVTPNTVTALSVSAATVFTFTVRATLAGEPIAEALTAAFNSSGDRADVDLGTGKLCCKLALTGTALRSAMGTAQLSTNLYVDLQIKNALGEATTVAVWQQPFLLDVTRDGSTTPDPGDPAYLTAVEIAALYALREPANANHRIRDARTLQVFDPDTGKMHTVRAKVIDGIVTLIPDQTGETP